MTPTTLPTTLICRLREHVITNDGDLIPAGTPVKVLGWATAEDAGKVEVRADAYVYADFWSGREESDEGCDSPAVGRGLRLAVHPGNIMYDECR